MERMNTYDVLALCIRIADGHCGGSGRGKFRMETGRFMRNIESGGVSVRLCMCREYKNQETVSLQVDLDLNEERMTRTL